MNSIGVSPYVNNLYRDLCSGLVLLQVIFITRRSKIVSRACGYTCAARGVHHERCVVALRMYDKWNDMHVSKRNHENCKCTWKKSWRQCLSKKMPSPEWTISLHYMPARSPIEHEKHLRWNMPVKLQSAFAHEYWCIYVFWSELVNFVDVKFHLCNVIFSQLRSLFWKFVTFDKNDFVLSFKALS